MKGCTKPDCDCIEQAELKAGGGVKNYPCLKANFSETTQLKEMVFAKVKMWATVFNTGELGEWCNDISECKDEEIELNLEHKSLCYIRGEFVAGKLLNTLKLVDENDLEINGSLLPSLRPK